jgi:hypothetical protein
MMNARRMGALAVTALAALAVGVLLAPGAQSGSNPGLDMTTRNSDQLSVPGNQTRTASALCPKGYHVTGIGERVTNADVIDVEKVSARKAIVVALGHPDTVGQVAVQVLCTTGTGGLRISDTSSPFIS